jgi:hypothetical protein
VVGLPYFFGQFMGGLSSKNGIWLRTNWKHLGWIQYQLILFCHFDDGTVVTSKAIYNAGYQRYDMVRVINICLILPTKMDQAED